MDYKEYLLNQDAISLAYIAKKMWPTNDNAKSYLSTKLNGKDDKRPWTAGDNRKAEIAIHELSIHLAKVAPNGAEQEKRLPIPKAKETHPKQAKPPKNAVVKEVKEPVSKKAIEKEPTMAELAKQLKV
ncbi:hypothetical protein [Mucilaginibacter sp. 10I4]|uniref:hypothetical protein n=1 Tax=Mucilaginibacter sp. 10I4 TaxID=3048580 RepID=UPI002B237AB2|nr:hypothetical protein [Mucilaginibacter sp. 10I4]MEB0262900.1 hypothetical protein [Mucilaginibacter sp. 10I4]